MTTPPGGASRPSGSMIVAAFLIVALAVVSVLASVTVLQLPEAVTSEGKDIKALYQVTLAISMLVYFGVTAGIIYAVFRFKRRRPELPVQIHGSSKLEIGWTVIPILILVALFIPALVLLIDLKTPPEDDEVGLTIEVIAHQWWWEFVYCQNGDCARSDNLHIQRTPPNYEALTPPVLVVPAGQTVRAYLRSTDVVHSFYWIKSLYKMQAIPGNVNQLHFRVEKEGNYYGQCYQFCGLRHSDMLFAVEAMSQSEFQTWLTQQRRAQGLDQVPDKAAAADKD